MSDGASEYPPERVGCLLCRAVSNTPHGHSSGSSSAFQALVCDESVVAPEQLSLLCGLTGQCVGGKCFHSFPWCVQTLRATLVFRLPNRCSIWQWFIESGVFFLRSKGSRVEAAWVSGGGMSPVLAS